MKTTIAVLAIMLLTSCQSKRIPEAPVITGVTYGSVIYQWIDYDATELTPDEQATWDQIVNVHDENLTEICANHGFKSFQKLPGYHRVCGRFVDYGFGPTCAEYINTRTAQCIK